MSVTVSKRSTMCIVCKKGMSSGILKMVIRSGSVHMRCWKQRGVQSPTSFPGFYDLDEEKQEEFLKWVNKWKQGNIVHVGQKRKRNDSEEEEETPSAKKSKNSTEHFCIELPKDAWGEITRFCDINSLVALSHVNKTLKQLTDTDEMWKNAAEEVFPSAAALKNKLKLSWKQLCIQGVYNGATNQSKTGPCGNCGANAYWDPLFELFVCHKCDGKDPFTFVSAMRAEEEYGLTKKELKKFPGRRKKYRSEGLDWYDTRSYAVTTYPELLLKRYVRAKEKAKETQEKTKPTNKTKKIRLAK